MMDKTYTPGPIEAKWYQAWLDRGLFHGDAARGGQPYCVVIPPPNVTGILHMGHALNNTIQDILVRWRRMQGRNVVWMPGTDHAGIATQNVVEKALRKEGKTRQDLGRDAFVERVWTWKEEYGSTIIRQLKRLGSSCDWARERFTMDEGLSDAVAEVFIRLYEKKLVYRANYIINWCPRCHTALSDEESEHQDTAGKLYYIRYPLREGAPTPAAPARKARAVRKPAARTARAAAERAYVVVATTRPETLLGDVAVAVSPKDRRYRDLEGRTVRLPVLNRELRVIRDDFVDPKFGTGVVKVTPAHDPNDFEMGQRHGLTPVTVMNGDGTMNEGAGPYAGLDRFECRKRIVADLQAQGLIERIEDHAHAVGHCYRCDTVVEPRLSPQWFVRMKPLAAPAIEAVKAGKVTFVPARWTKVYLEWMENIRDWCISRQIWWGHRIPVFDCAACGHQWAAKGRPAACPSCGASDIRQDEDVLDTWFSSWLWPFSTFGWPGANKDLAFYYPTHDLVTASEIIFFWVARMIVGGIAFMGDVPFRNVYIHGTVRDDQGRKMSKSLGNAIDPLGIIEEFSADALRFSLTMLTATGQDVYISKDKFEVGRNFGTKLWNAARFMQMQQEKLPGFDPAAGRAEQADAPRFDPALLSPDDQHILARLDAAVAACTDNLEKFRFNDAALALYEFLWHQFCDWYVEYAKEVFYGPDEARRRLVLTVMHTVFSRAVRLLHPFMPFLTEELWHVMGYGAEAESIMLAPWPAPAGASQLAAWGVRPEAVAYVEDKHDLVRVGRTLRADFSIPPARKVIFRVRPPAETAAALRADQASVTALLKAERIDIDPDLAAPGSMPSALSRLGTIYMRIEGVLDAAAERARLTAQVAETQGHLERISRKLMNHDFVSRAPAAVVEQQRARQNELIEQAQKLQRLIDTLGAA